MLSAATQVNFIVFTYFGLMVIFDLMVGSYSQNSLVFLTQPKKRNRLNCYQLNELHSILRQIANYPDIQKLI